MKKIALLLLMLCCVTCLTAAMAEESLPAFAELTGLSDFLARTDAENPIVYACFSHRYGFSTAEFSTTNPERISRVISALKELEIIGISDMDVTDWYPYLGLRAADGTTLSMSFNGEWLEIDRTHYELSGVKAFYGEMDRLIKETTESRRTIFLNGMPVDLTSITLRDFYNAGFKAEFGAASGEAYITHPDYSGGMVVGITDEDPDSPLTFVSMAFADDLPVVWCGGTPDVGWEYWENELEGLLYDMPENMEGYDPALGWRCADFYFGSGPWIRLVSKGDAPELQIIRE